MKRDLAVVYTHKTDNRTYKGFNSSTHTKSFSGVKALLQKITKLLLTPLGSDMYNPTIGSSIPYFLSHNGAQIDQSLLEAEVLKSIGQIENSIKYGQATDQTLSDEERLKSIELESVSVEAGGSEVTITLLIVTMQNDTYIVRI